MSEFKGTKGVFSFSSVAINKNGDIPKTEISMYCDNGLHICDKVIITKLLPEHLYNFQLMSKAPEMLEMLIKCEKVISELEIATDDIKELIKSATEI